MQNSKSNAVDALSYEEKRVRFLIGAAVAPLALLLFRLDFLLVIERPILKGILTLSTIALLTAAMLFSVLIVSLHRDLIALFEKPETADEGHFLNVYDGYWEDSGKLIIFGAILLASGYLFLAALLLAVLWS
ncbi:hypothetical protein [Sulfitobacter geojensis]|uniref:hypothetical protein n=1 Tax=Sulfitobacter geojensis TaxID=1342299 RepID=UPI0036D7AFEA